MQCKPTRRRAPGCRQRGNAVVELALVLTPLVMVLTATADLGRALYTYDTLTKAVRGAARRLALAAPVGSSAAVQSAARAEALNLVLTGRPDGSGAPLVPNLGADMVEVCVPATCPALANVNVNSGLVPPTLVNLVSVSITGYTYRSMFSFVLPASLRFDPISLTMRQAS